MEKEKTPLENRKLIGQILVEKGYINLYQLNEARRKQLLTDPDLRLPLGEVLVQMGYVAPVQIEEAQKLQKTEPRSL